MPLFSYQAITAEGRTLKGVIDADSLMSAKERLRKQQILVTALHTLKGKENPLALSPTLLLGFTRELAQLLKAGLPLYESLQTIEEKYSSHKVHSLFLDLCDHLKEGSSLSVALKRYPTTFDKIYLSMVQAAEQSGNLVSTFEQLAQLIARQQKLKKQLVSALAYPSLLMVFCFGVVCGLLFFVIPSLKELFEGRDLHPFTALVLTLSRFANDHVYFLGLVFSLFFVVPFLLLRTSGGKYFLYSALLRFPLANTLLLHSALVRLCRSLAMLLSGGVPLLEALTLARGVVKSPLIEDAITAAVQRVSEGEPLSLAFKGAPVIPSLVLRMLSLAEETGTMSTAFFNLSEIYDEEMERHLHQLTTLLQPALLIILGGIVGLVVLAILLPLTDMSSFTAT